MRQLPNVNYAHVDAQVGTSALCKKHDYRCAQMGWSYIFVCSAADGPIATGHVNAFYLFHVKLRAAPYKLFVTPLSLNESVYG